MPIPFLLPAALQGASALIGGLIGHSQRKEGKKLLANTPYPNMPIPGEITRQAGEGLPSQQYAQAQRNIQRAQTNAILGAQSRRGGLGMLGKIQSGTNDATLNLDVADAQQRQQNELRLAQYKTKQWDWNVRNKYQQNYDYAQSLLGAGRQNQFGAIDKGVGAAGMLFSGMNFGGGGYGHGSGRNNLAGVDISRIPAPQNTKPTFTSPAQKFNRINY